MYNKEMAVLVCLPNVMDLLHKLGFTRYLRMSEIFVAKLSLNPNCGPITMDSFSGLDKERLSPERIFTANTLEYPSRWINTAPLRRLLTDGFTPI